MPLAGVIGASLAVGLTAPARSLWIGGLDVVLKPGTPGNKYGVPIETVDITEAGPGGVSSMTFTIDDPLLEVTLAEGQFVRLFNHLRGLPEFAGLIQGWTIRPVTTGRQIDVVCQGLEVALDWLMIPSLTIPAGTDMVAAIQSAYANTVGTAPPLRAFAASGVLSCQATPIEGVFMGTFPAAYALVFTNVTLRQAIQSIFQACIVQPATDPYVFDVTVDFYSGLRVIWATYIYATGTMGVGSPSDWATIPNTETHADLKNSGDAGGAFHNVLVIGGNAAGSGLVTDGTGLPSKTAQLNDPSILTAAARDQAGRTYLIGKGVVTRGSLRFEEPTFETTMAPGTEYHPGSSLQVNDAQAMPNFGIRSTNLQKRLYANGRADWTFAFGGNPPELSAQVRRLTAGSFV